MSTKHRNRKSEATAAKAEPAVSNIAASVSLSVTTDSSVADVCVLPTSCTVRESAALKAELLPLIDRDNVITLDVRAVERIDTAALQLLVAFVRDRNQMHHDTNWIGAPECINEAVKILGMADTLNIRTARIRPVVA